jgi:hypothetical protein
VRCAFFFSVSHSATIIFLSKYTYNYIKTKQTKAKTKYITNRTKTKTTTIKEMTSPTKSNTDDAVVDLENAATNSGEHAMKKNKKQNCLGSTYAIVVYVAIFFVIVVLIILFVRANPSVYKTHSTFQEIDVADGASVRFSYGEKWDITNWNENDCMIEKVGLQEKLRIRPVIGTDGCKDVEIAAIPYTVQVSKFTASSNASIKVDGFQGGKLDEPSIPATIIGDLKVDVSSSGSVTFQGGVIREITGSVDGENSKVTFVQVNTTDVKSVIQCKKIEATNGGTLEGFDDVSDDCSN